MDCQVKRPVYIGADHTISSLGEGTDANFRKIRNYESGLRKVSDSSLFHEDFLAGRIDRDLIEADSLTDEFTFLEKLYIRVIDSILCTSGIDVGSDSLKVIFSSTKGNIDLLKSETETIDPAVFLSETAHRIHRHFGFKHTCETISNACISGVSALIIAQRLIRTGQYDHVLVVGGDLLTHFVVSGFQSFHSVSENPCRPFDQSRDGLSLGEACAGVLLTSQTDKAIYPFVELKGGGISNDANHISGPSRTGDGLAFAIQAALTEADLPTQEIGLINAHGTATLFNDEMESKAIHLAGLEQVPVNSLKPYIGHKIGRASCRERVLRLV